MAPHTTSSDVATFTGQAFTDVQVTRMTTLIPLAERWVKRVVRRDFYDATDATSDASQDWLHVVSLVVEHALHDEDPEIRDKVLSPFQTERLGDYQYTKAAGVSASSVEGDPRIAELLAPYMTVSLPGLVVNGPTRVAPAIVDCDVDISRGWR